MYVTIGNLFFAAIGALLWFFLATQMTATVYGSLNFFISISAIFTSIGLLGFDSTLTTYLAKRVKSIEIESAQIVLLSGIVLSVVLQAMFNSFALTLSFLGMLFFSLSTAELLGRHRYKEFMYVMVVERTISLFTVPILFWLYGVDGALYGYAISYLPLCYRFVMSLNKLRFDFRFGVIRTHRNFFFHSYGLSLSRTLMFLADKLLIAPIFGLYILGQYQLGIQMLTATSMIPLIFYNYLLPQYAGNTHLNHRNLELTGIIIITILTVVIIAIIPYIVNSLFPAFTEAIMASQIVIVAGIPLTISALCNSALMGKEKSSQVMQAGLIFLASQYALLFVLGHTHGLVGLSFATLIAACVQAAFLYAKRRQLLN
jgi:O-antigen/teichoic acid export membrane protein